MAKMTEEAKAKLREIALQKRKEKPLAKDFDIADWAMALDMILENGEINMEEERHLLMEDIHRNCMQDCRYLRWVPKTVVEYLTTRIPHVRVNVKVPRRPWVSHVVPVFPDMTILTLFALLHLPTGKYTNKTTLYTKKD